jgi:hypothetical protein
MIITKYVGVIDGLETYEVYLDGVLIGTNQSITDAEQE